PSTLYFGSPACALPTHNRTAVKHETLPVSAKIFLRLCFIDFLLPWLGVAHAFIARNQAGRIGVFRLARPTSRSLWAITDPSWILLSSIAFDVCYTHNSGTKADIAGGPRRASSRHISACS